MTGIGWFAVIMKFVEYFVLSRPWSA